MNKRIALAAAVTATGLLAVPSFASAATSCNYEPGQAPGERPAR